MTIEEGRKMMTLLGRSHSVRPQAVEVLIDSGAWIGLGAGRGNRFKWREQAFLLSNGVVAEGEQRLGARALQNQGIRKKKKIT